MNDRQCRNLLPGELRSEDRARLHGFGGSFETQDFIGIGGDGLRNSRRERSSSPHQNHGNDGKNHNYGG
jgi:hypothetical protein